MRGPFSPPKLTSPATYSNAMNAACANAGYNASNASELTQCTDTLAGVVNALAGGTGYAASDVFKQMLIGQTMNEVLLDNSPSLAMTVLANRNTGSSLVGAGMAANEWLPVFKAVMTAVGITLIPFLVIFLPTPLAKKALYLICGIFVYITAWGVIDAIIHSMAMDYAMTTLSGIITQGQLGMLSLNFFSTGPAQVLAVMGGMRWGGMMLAGAVSAAFVGVGGSVLGQMAVFDSRHCPACGKFGGHDGRDPGRPGAAALCHGDGAHHDGECCQVQVLGQGQRGYGAEVRGNGIRHGIS